MMTIEYFPEDRDGFGHPDSFRRMFSSSGSWYTGQDDDPYAVFLVVKTDGDAPDDVVYEEDALKCAMEGLFGLFNLHGEDQETARRLDAWCGSRIRKIVKRAKGAKWRKLLDMMRDCDIPSLVVSDMEGPASVAVFAPMRISEQPKALRSLQVSGLELPSDGIESPAVPGYLDIILDRSLGLSTGKAVAQAGHALQLAFRDFDGASWDAWRNMGYGISVRQGDIEARGYPVVVTDAGFTEIAPGTRTAVAEVAGSREPS